MKDLNEYGRDVMNAQSHLEAIDANIASTETALSSLKEDREVAVKSFENAKQALQDAADRIKSGDYGVTDTLPEEGDARLAGIESQVRPMVFLDENLNTMTDEVFEGLNRTPPDDDADYQLAENRTHASNGAGV